MNADLELLLTYTNKPVISHFCYYHPHYSIAEGESLFQDLLSWMWLNKQRLKEGKETPLFGPLLDLDKLWHTFIIHTREYTDFCSRFFGEYFHHEIEPIGYEHFMEEEELRDYVQDCFLHIGQEWVERRFMPALTD